MHITTKIRLLLIVVISISLLPVAQAQQKNYTIKTSWDTTLHTFKTGDKISYSMQEGLYHYRAGKLLNRYKIIPRKIKLKKVAPCQVPPCPVFEYQVLVYYVDVWQRYLWIKDGSSLASLNISAKKYNTMDTLPISGWEPVCRLVKK